MSFGERDAREGAAREETTTMATKVHYRSEDDRIECSDHAPHRGSDTYRQRRYRPMNALQQVHARAVLLQERLIGWDEPLCEVCRGIARRAKTTMEIGK
jgi:hypothetical protein